METKLLRWHLFNRLKKRNNRNMIKKRQAQRFFLAFFILLQKFILVLRELLPFFFFLITLTKVNDSFLIEKAAPSSNIYLKICNIRNANYIYCSTVYWNMSKALHFDENISKNCNWRTILKYMLFHIYLLELSEYIIEILIPRERERERISKTLLLKFQYLPNVLRFVEITCAF